MIRRKKQTLFLDATEETTIIQVKKMLEHSNYPDTVFLGGKFDRNGALRELFGRSTGAA